MVNDSDYTLEVNASGWGLTQRGFLHYLKPPKPLITIITLRVLIYCCELSHTLSIAFSCLILIVLQHFPVLFHQQGRPACDPVVGWEAGLMICCTAFDSLRRRASAPQPRVSGERVALFSPSLGSRRPSGAPVRFSLLTLRHIPVLSVIWNVIPGVCGLSEYPIHQRSLESRSKW